jgi:hypothetical protein
LPDKPDVEPTLMEPDDPELDVPELKINTPLAPAAPEFDDRIEMAPLVLGTPEPLETPTAPPVSTVL